MKELLKLLQDFRNMTEESLPNRSPETDFIFDEVFELVNDYAASKLFKETMLKKGLRHFEVGGVDWFVQVDFTEGQEQTHDLPGYDSYYEIGLIFNSKMEEIDMGSDLWDFLANEIETLHL